MRWASYSHYFSEAWRIMCDRQKQQQYNHTAHEHRRRPQNEKYALAPSWPDDGEHWQTQWSSNNVNVCVFVRLLYFFICIILCAKITTEYEIDNCIHVEQCNCDRPSGEGGKCRRNCSKLSIGNWYMVRFDNEEIHAHNIPPETGRWQWQCAFFLRWLAGPLPMQRPSSRWAQYRLQLCLISMIWQYLVHFRSIYGRLFSRRIDSDCLFRTMAMNCLFTSPLSANGIFNGICKKVANLHGHFDFFILEFYHTGCVPNYASYRL